MTGFARTDGTHGDTSWYWEARSVNGRNLEIRCRVPQGLDRLENPARNAVGTHLRRGNVSLTLTVTSEQQGKPLRINRALLAELARRGWSHDDLVKVSGGNLLRVMRAAEAVSQRLRAAHW